MREKGTEELRSRRKFLAGEGDSTLTTFPLGILLANSAISEPEYRAGCRFAWLHARVIGKGSIAAIDFERTHGRALQEVDEDREEELQSLWRETRECLGCRQAFDEMVNLCVYERTPRFMRPIIPVPRDVTQGHNIKAWLCTLAKAYGYLDLKRAVA